MSHLIDMTRGTASIAYTNDVPWHGLGVSMPKGASLPEWQKAAKLDWHAKSSPVTYRAESDVSILTRDFPSRKVLYRSDTGHGLGVVGDKYRVVQPDEIVNFYADLCERFGYTMETMGGLKDGRIVWALANTDHALDLGPDRVGGYLLLSTSFDGTAATQARFTTVRVVCNNTLTMAVGEKANVSIAHNAKFDAAAVKAELGIGESFDATAKAIRRMANTEVTKQQQVSFFLDVYRDMTAAAVATLPDKKAIDREMERLAGILQFAPGANMASAENTVWGLLNAVTYDVDHNLRARTDDSRLASAWFGAGEARKNKALSKALELIGQ